MLSREEATQQLLDAKHAKNLSFEAIGARIGAHPIWTAAAIYGQASMTAEQATDLVAMLGLGPDVTDVLQQCPLKGSLDSAVPVDPLIYRFHEITQVYGKAIKAIIHEKFGDGIMSAIDFHMDIQKQEDPKGDRVVVVFNGKFLPYKRW
jgi:cyanate lyase